MKHTEAMRIEQLYQIYLKHPKVIIDSRLIEPGCLFIALKGPNFDANAFALSALEKGAAYAVVDDNALAGNDRCFVVPDTLVALQQLALHHRRTWSIPVVGITGTNGKTTTKELVAVVLQTSYPVHYTKGNLNNHIGVPLTILSCPKEAEIAVIEMGANKPGDIAELCAIAEPTHGLITNIGKAHLEGFGGLSGVKRTKSELYKYLAKHNGLVFINRDEKYLTQLAQKNTKRILYGRQTEAHLNDAVLKSTEPFLTIEMQGNLMPTRIPGTYNFPNILTALSVGAYFKVNLKLIAEALANYEPRMNRSQVMQWRGAQILLDAYNANPSSMDAALAHFKDQKVHKKAILIADMFELGADAEKEHKKIYTQATKTGADLLITIGSQFGKIPHRKTDLHFETTDALKVWFQSQNWDGYHLLLKGSRGMGLEKVLD
jgi:UDP-N-acetylmuramoyl-tripeptide--D-alanyl-D-alanine ligase